MQTTLFSGLVNRIKKENLLRTFFIPIKKLVSHNQYIALERGNRFAAHATKKRLHEAIIMELYLLKIKPLELGVYHVHTVWAVHNKRTDLDNTAWAKKYVFDALVGGGILPTDSLKCIDSLSDDYTLVTTDKTGVYVEIYNKTDILSLIKEDVATREVRPTIRRKRKDRNEDSGYRGTIDGLPVYINIT